MAKDGTPSDDFRAMSSDSDAGTQTPISEPAKEITDQSDRNSAKATDQHVVELCSAANVVEAYALRALLQEAAIPSRVVGENLGNASGWLPLGEPIAPRIWVRSEDLVRARAVIDEPTKQRALQPDQIAEDGEQAATDTISEEEDGPRISSIGKWLSGAFVIAGAACLLVGIVWGLQAWMLMRKYAGTTEGRPIRCVPRFSGYELPRSEIPIPRDRFVFSVCYEVDYAFLVNGKMYTAVGKVPELEFVAEPIAIHYDPHEPATCVAGSLTSPWTVWAFSLPIGGVLVFAGWHLARKSRDRTVRM